MSRNESSGDIIISIRIFAISLIVLAGIYPAMITLYANTFFPWKAKGSVISDSNRNVASTLVAQDFEKAGLFHGRPSAASFNTLPSGASNLGRTSLDLSKLVKEREIKLLSEGIDPKACPELLYASASGIDPHITPICAKEQGRVLSVQSTIRKDEIENLILKNTEFSIFGFIGRERVNVVKLNIDFRKLMNAK